MFELTIIVNFEAAHCLPEYPGKCNRLHGHNWKVEVTVQGAKLDRLGMLMDFGQLKQEVNNVITTLDHYYLNELEYFQAKNPTAENIAQYIFLELAKSPIFKQDIRIISVKVWESSHSAATYRQGV